MRNTTNKSKGAITLRKIAEEFNHKNGLLQQDSEFRQGKVLELIHELEIHQIELEMQNEELIRAKEQVVVDNEKYNEVYDFAPSEIGRAHV